MINVHIQGNFLCASSAKATEVPDQLPFTTILSLTGYISFFHAYISAYQLIWKVQ